MPTAPGKNVVIRLGTIGQLFNAPDINPFSGEEVDVLGEPALRRSVRSLIGPGMVTAISVVIIALPYLLLNSVLADASDTARDIVAASLSVFVWVILWDPMEKLLFEWVEPRQ